MHGRGAPWWLIGVLCVILGAAAGKAIVQPDRLTLLAVGGAIAAMASVSVGLHRHSSWVAWAFVPFMQLAAVSSTLALLPLPLMALNLAMLWPEASARQRRACLLVAGLVAWALFVGVAMTPRSEATFQQSLAIVGGGLLAAVVIVTAPSTRAVCKVLVTIGLVMSIMASQIDGFAQARSLTVLGENANGTALLAVLGSLAAMILARTAPRGRGLVWWAGSLVCASGVLWTGSRGALLGLLGGVIAMLIVRLVRKSSSRLLATVVGGVLVAFVAPPLVLRLFEISGRGLGQDNSLAVRELTLRLALEVGLDHPLTGAGMGSLSEISARNPEVGLGLSAHNVFAGIFAELGAITLVLFLSVLVMAGLVAARERSGLVLPLLVAVVAMGLSVEWWPGTRLGPICMLVVGLAMSRVVTSDLPRAQQRQGHQTRSRSNA